LEITQTLYVKNRKEWRSWLEKNHDKAKEIWLIYYNKKSAKERISYNDAVDVALCFGWIDSTVKPVDNECSAQRFSRRRKNSQLSELNKERVRRLIKSEEMTQAGLDSLSKHFESNQPEDGNNLTLREFFLPEDILDILKEDPMVWENFQKFDDTYKKIRLAYIDGARHRPEEFQKRLRFFIKMTAKNKRFGMLE
jgi:uncharacterized protein YdeI (YjbR/CyaY-like superfamily)